MEGRRAAVEQAARRSADPALLAALVEANAALPPSAARDRHLKLLRQPGTVAVVTGQQAGLFLGPLFTLYKAATAVVAARALEKETGHACVPIFWLQNEDHDVAEINTCAIPTGRQDALHVSLQLDGAKESRTPVAHWKVGASIGDALSDVRAGLGAEPHAPEVLALLEQAYAPGVSLSDAFAQLFSRVFQEEGLVVVDVRNPLVGRHAAAFHQRALDAAPGLASALGERVKELEAAGFGTQVHIRDGAPLAFFSPDAVDGPRYRMEPAGTPGSFTLVGHPGGLVVTEEQLRRALQEEPLRFTTSALLRPLLQDTWFPVAGYVGGPGEIAYFSQLQPAYAVLGMEMPLLIPRARFRVLDDRTRTLLEKLGMTADEACAPATTLVERLAARAAREGFEAPDAVEKRLLGDVLAQVDALGARMALLDPSLLKAATRTKDAVQEAVSKMVGKYARALAQRDGLTNERLEKVQSFLKPGNAPQERIYGIPYFAARHGLRPFVDAVMAAVQPFHGALEDLTP